MTENADLWIIRVNREMKLTSSSPCASCLSALKKYKIRRVFFSTEEGTITKMNVDDIPEFHTRRQKQHGDVCKNWNLT